MSKKILKWLNRPFSLKTSLKELFIEALGFGIFISLFLLIFKPFGIENDVDLPFLGFGVVTFFVTFISSEIITKLQHPFFSEENWTISKKIMSSILL